MMYEVFIRKQFTILNVFINLLTYTDLCKPQFLRASILISLEPSDRHYYVYSMPFFWQFNGTANFCLSISILCILCNYTTFFAWKSVFQLKLLVGFSLHPYQILLAVVVEIIVC